MCAQRRFVHCNTGSRGSSLVDYVITTTNLFSHVEYFDIHDRNIFKTNTHLYKFTSISVSHRIELFDKLILPILNYASEVWGFAK